MAADSFTQRWQQAAKDEALLPNSRKSYWCWTKIFFRYLGRGASTWTGRDWENFERYLIDKRYSYSARRQARCAVNFIFRSVLRVEIGKLDLPLIPKPEHALVVVPTREELGRIFTNLRAQERLACRIMHGSGTRVEETCRIRVHDLDLERGRLRVWDGKGEKNRETVLPHNLIPTLQKQMEWRRALHERDLADGNGFVELPSRLGRKMRNAARELGWQWLLVSSKVQQQHRWYLSPDTIGNALRKARRAAGIIKRITCHSLRKAFASELAALGMDPRTIQALLGHEHFDTTATYYLSVNMTGAFSPADVSLINPVPAVEAPQRRVYLLQPATA